MFRLVYLFSFVYLELLDNLLVTQIYQLRANSGSDLDGKIRRK